MKTQKEIEQLASKRFIIKQFIGEDDYNRSETIAARYGYAEGYTQCQEDMLNLMDDYQTWIFKTSGPLKSFKQWVDESLNKQD